jgi:hypothetical protein
MSGDGLVRGFASFAGPGCSTMIWYFRGIGARWTPIRTPYSGEVLSAARDHTGTYVLFLSPDGVRLGKFTPQGVFRPSLLLSATTSDVNGDLAAAGGTWWAVWSEPTGHYDTGELYQAKTYGSDVARQQITRNELPDLEPSITLQPAWGATMAWTRNNLPVEPTGSDIWLGTSADGTWTQRAVFTLGRYNSAPQLFATAATVYVGWIRDAASHYADNASGRYGVTAFPRPEGAGAVQPRVSAAAGVAYLGWLAAGEEFEPIVLAAARAGTWDQQVITGVGPAGAGMLRHHAVIGRESTATVLYSVPGTLFAATADTR